jgi:hypothetical protein
LINRNDEQSFQKQARLIEPGRTSVQKHWLRTDNTKNDGQEDAQRSPLWMLHVPFMCVLIPALSILIVVGVRVARDIQYMQGHPNLSMGHFVQITGIDTKRTVPNLVVGGTHRARFLSCV